MKKRSMRNIYIILTGMCIAMVIVAVTMSVKVNNARSGKNINNEISAGETIESEKARSYTIKKYKQSIAVFDENENICDILDVNYSMLSDEDKKSLNDGIYAENDEQLRKIKEDFES
jgi:hypothetical protein